MKVDIVEEIIEDLKNRAGFDQVWEATDHDIKDEIEDSWNEIIKAALAEKEAEIGKLKEIARRSKYADCCCEYDVPDNPSRIIKPCAFHEEWRDGQLAEKEREIARLKLEISELMELLHTDQNARQLAYLRSITQRLLNAHDKKLSCEQEDIIRELRAVMKGGRNV